LKALVQQLGLVEGPIDDFEVSPDELYLEFSSPTGEGTRSSFLWRRLPKLVFSATAITSAILFQEVKKSPQAIHVQFIVRGSSKRRRQRRAIEGSSSSSITSAPTLRQDDAMLASLFEATAKKIGPASATHLAAVEAAAANEAQDIIDWLARAGSRGASCASRTRAPGSGFPHGVLTSIKDQGP
jgi:hypothetical protein